MKPCVLILSNSDSGLYDFRREVLQALLDEGRRVLIRISIGYRLCAAHPGTGLRIPAHLL